MSELVPKIKFSEFSHKWKHYKLCELSEIRSASRVHKEQWTESGVPFFRTSDVVSAYKGKENNKAFISIDLFKELSNKSGQIKKNDLLVTGGGSIGVPYLVPNNEPLYFKDADLLWFKNKGIVNDFYLYTFFLTPQFRSHLRRISHTGTISHYTIEQAKSTPINLPSLIEQQKIASFLTSVDSKISQLTEKQRLLKEYKKGVMQQIFSQQLRFKDKDGKDFPEWKYKPLSYLLLEHKCRNKEQKFGKKDVLSVSGELGVVNQIKHLGRSYAGESVAPYHIVHEGDIVYTKSPLKNNPYGIIKANLGRAGIVSTLYAVYSCKKTAYPKHLNYYFSLNDNVNRYLRPLVHKGAKNDMKINNQRVLIDPIYFPCYNEQIKISNFFEALDTKIRHTQNQIKKTKQFKKGLLQQMFV